MYTYTFIDKLKYSQFYDAYDVFPSEIIYMVLLTFKTFGCLKICKTKSCPSELMTFNS